MKQLRIDSKDSVRFILPNIVTAPFYVEGGSYFGDVPVIPKGIHLGSSIQAYTLATRSGQYAPGHIWYENNDFWGMTSHSPNPISLTQTNASWIEKINHINTTLQSHIEKWNIFQNESGQEVGISLKTSSLGLGNIHRPERATLDIGGTLWVERQSTFQGRVCCQKGVQIGGTTLEEPGMVRFDGDRFQGYTGSCWMDFHDVSSSSSHEKMPLQFNDTTQQWEFHDTLYVKSLVPWEEISLKCATVGITDVPTPCLPSDIVNKAYCDANHTGLGIIRVEAWDKEHISEGYIWDDGVLYNKQDGETIPITPGNAQSYYIIGPEQIRYIVRCDASKSKWDEFVVYSEKASPMLSVLEGEVFTRIDMIELGMKSFQAQWNELQERTARWERKQLQPYGPENMSDLFWKTIDEKIRYATNTTEPRSITGSFLAFHCLDPHHFPSEGLPGYRIITPRTVTNVLLAEQSVESHHIANQVVQSQHIGYSQVQKQHIMEQQITSEHIQPLSIQTKHIQEYSVQTRHIAPGSASTSWFSPGTIHGDVLMVDTVLGKHMAKQVVTLGHMHPSANHISVRLDYHSMWKEPGKIWKVGLGSELVLELARDVAFAKWSKREYPRSFGNRSDLLESQVYIFDTHTELGNPKSFHQVKWDLVHKELDLVDISQHWSHLRLWGWTESRGYFHHIGPTHIDGHIKSKQVQELESSVIPREALIAWKKDTPLPENWEWFIHPDENHNVAFGYIQRVL